MDAEISNEMKKPILSGRFESLHRLSHFSSNVAKFPSIELLFAEGIEKNLKFIRLNKIPCASFQTYHVFKYCPGHLGAQDRFVNWS